MFNSPCHRPVSPNGQCPLPLAAVTVRTGSVVGLRERPRSRGLLADYQRLPPAGCRKVSLVRCCPPTLRRELAPSRHRRSEPAVRRPLCWLPAQPGKVPRRRSGLGAMSRIVPNRPETAGASDQRWVSVRSPRAGWRFDSLMGGWFPSAGSLHQTEWALRFLPESRLAAGVSRDCFGCFRRTG